MASNRVPRVAVDFDGVIMRRDGTHQPIDGAREGVESLRRQGYEVVVHSTRALSRQGEDWIRSWLRQHAIPHADVTSRKVDADAYLDDKAVRFEGWQGVSIKQGSSRLGPMHDAYMLAKAQLAASEG